MDNVKNIIAVMSGKGGVGKSFVTSSVAVELKNKGYKVGILDADITGPSIPKMFGLKEKLLGDETGMFPAKTKDGIEIVSINLLLNDESDPVIWRGPVLSSAIKQFKDEVHWGELDYLLIDMPPGTGDVALTVLHEFEIDGALLVSSPQELVKLIVTKIYKMLDMMKVDIIGLIENFSYIECPDCGKKISVFGESNADEVAKEFNIDLLAKLPIMPELTKKADEGEFEKMHNENFDNVIKKIVSISK